MKEIIKKYENKIEKLKEENKELKTILSNIDLSYVNIKRILLEVQANSSDPEIKALYPTDISELATGLYKQYHAQIDFELAKNKKEINLPNIGKVHESYIVYDEDGNPYISTLG